LGRPFEPDRRSWAAPQEAGASPGPTRPQAMLGCGRRPRCAAWHQDLEKPQVHRTGPALPGTKTWKSRRSPALRDGTCATWLRKARSALHAYGTGAGDATRDALSIAQDGGAELTCLGLYWFIGVAKGRGLRNDQCKQCQPRKARGHDQAPLKGRASGGGGEGFSPVPAQLGALRKRS
jgi:hypothetical protein